MATIPSPCSALFGGVTHGLPKLMSWKMRMRDSLLLCVGVVCLSTSALGQVRTDAAFTRYFGDVTPVGANFETDINGVAVTPDPAVVVAGVEQGELLLPANTSSVEFKNRQVFSGSPFNTPSLIAWTPFNAPVPATSDGVFEFGTFTITNGIFFNQASFDVTFTTTSSDPGFNGRSFSDTITYVVTPNLGVDNFVDADYVVFKNHPELGQVHVYEAASGLGNTGTVELWGKVGSLDPLFFANPTGGVALDVAAVPEPSEWLLMFAGFAAMASVASRRRRT
jgi:hypothetical protein